MSWKEEGLKQQKEFLVKIAAKSKPTNWEKNFYKVMTGDVDYSDADAGEERVIRYQE